MKHSVSYPNNFCRVYRTRQKQFDPKTERFGSKQFYKWHTVPFIKQFKYETFCFISKQFVTLLCQIEKMYKCIQNIQYKSTYRKQQ